MARKIKNYQGDHRSWEESYFAYGVTDNKAVLVRFDDLESAKEEKERMKWSDACTVGYTSRKISELELRAECRRRGWKVVCIRGT